MWVGHVVFNEANPHGWAEEAASSPFLNSPPGSFQKLFCPGTLGKKKKKKIQLLLNLNFIPEDCWGGFLASSSLWGFGRVQNQHYFAARSISFDESWVSPLCARLQHALLNPARWEANTLLGSWPRCSFRLNCWAKPLSFSAKNLKRDCTISSSSAGQEQGWRGRFCVMPFTPTKGLGRVELYKI